MRLNPSPWQVFASQMETATVTLPLANVSRVPNPRPLGVIRHGSATHAVLLLLRDNPGERFTCFGLCLRTGHTLKAVNHACLYLRGMGFIETFGDPRNTRFLTYAISKSGSASPFSHISKPGKN